MDIRTKQIQIITPYCEKALVEIRVLFIFKNKRWQIWQNQKQYIAQDANGELHGGMVGQQ
jgi:hypothetical protein